MTATRWDVARRTHQCTLCPTVIGAGEQFRQYTPKNLPICIACAKRTTGEDPPPDMPVQPLVPALKPPPVWNEPTEPLLMSTKERRLRTRYRERQMGLD